MNPEEIPEDLPTEPAPEPVVEEATETPSEIAAREAEVAEVKKLAVEESQADADIREMQDQASRFEGTSTINPRGERRPEGTGERGLLQQVVEAGLTGVDLEGGGRLGDDSVGPEGMGARTEPVPMVDPLVAAAASLHESFKGTWEGYLEGFSLLDDPNNTVVEQIAGGVGEGMVRGTVNALWNLPSDISVALGGPDFSVDLQEFYDGGEEGGTWYNELSTGMGQFMSIFLPTTMALKPVGAAAGATRLGKATSFRFGRSRAMNNIADYAVRVAGGGMIADSLAFNPELGNLSSMIRATEWAQSHPDLDAALSYIDSREYANSDDPVGNLKGRMANLLEGAAIGVVFDGALRQFGKAFTGFKLPADEALAGARYNLSRKRMGEATGALLTRMKRAEDLMNEGVKFEDLELRLQQEGLGLDAIRKDQMLPAFAQLFSDSFNIPIEEATRVVNMFASAGGDMNRLFVGGSESMTPENTRRTFFQQSTDQAHNSSNREIFEILQTAKHDTEVDVRASVKGDFAYLTPHSDSIPAIAANRHPFAAIPFYSRVHRVSKGSPQRIIGSTEIDGWVEGQLKTGKFSRDEWVFGGYEDYVSVMKKAGLALDLDDMVRTVEGVRLWTTGTRQVPSPEGPIPGKNQFPGTEVDGTPSRYGEYLAPGSEYTNTFEMLVGTTNIGNMKRMVNSAGHLAPEGYTVRPGEVEGTHALYGPDGEPVLLGPHGFEEPLTWNEPAEMLRFIRQVNDRMDAGIPTDLRRWAGLMDRAGSHWDHLAGSMPILGFLRMSRRRSTDGERVLYIEEFQSDFANQVAATKKTDEVRARTPEERRAASARAETEGMPPVRQTDGAQVEGGYGTARPDGSGRASDLWVTIMARRVIAFALENGYDKIALTSGDGVNRIPPTGRDTTRTVEPETGFGISRGPGGNEVKGDLGYAGANYESKIPKAIERAISMLGGTNPKRRQGRVEFRVAEVDGQYKIFDEETGEAIDDVNFNTKEEAEDAIVDMADEFEADPEDLPLSAAASDSPDEMMEVGEAGIFSLAGVDRDRILAEGGIPLAQAMRSGETGIHGSAWVDTETGVAFVRGIENPDLSTAIHEMGHALHVQLLANGDEASVRALNEAFGVVDGAWTRDNFEDFARSFEAFVRDPSSVAPAQAKAMGQLASKMRSIYRDIKGSPLEGKLTDEQRAMFEGLEIRTDIPIEYAPGKFMPAIDWAPIVARARDLEEEGKDWRSELKPEDLLSVARRDQYVDPADQTRPGNFGFDMESEEGMLRYLAAYQELNRHMEVTGVGSKRMNREELQWEAIKQFNRMMGNGEDVAGLLDEIAISDARNPGQGVRNIYTGQMMLNTSLQDVVRLRDIVEADPTPQNMAKFHRAMQTFGVVHQVVANLRSESGNNLAAWADHFSMPTQKQLDDAGTASAFNDATGNLDLSETIAAVGAAKNLDDGGATASAIIRAQTSGALGKSQSVLKEIFVNGLLSSIRTFLGLSIMSPLVSMAADGTSRAVAGLATGNTGVAGEVAVNFGRNVANINIAAKFAAKAWAGEQPVLMNTRGLLDEANPHLAITSQNLAPNAPAAVKTAIDYFGKMVRAPGSRSILTIDEFFRQMSSRTDMQSRYWREVSDEKIEAAIERGDLPADMTRAERRQYLRDQRGVIMDEVDNRIESTLRDGRLRDQRQLTREAMEDPVIAAIEDPVKRTKAIRDYVENQNTAQVASDTAAAADAAVKPVFQAELTGSAKVAQTALDQIPLARYVVPFFRTPVNLISRFLDYTPAGDFVELAERAFNKGLLPESPNDRRFRKGSRNFATRHMEDLQSGDPMRVAEARGRTIMGLGLFSTGYYLAENGDITGNGPTEPGLRAAWLQTNQPYSIRIGDGRWVSYQRLDPFAMHLGMVADFHDGVTGEYMSDEDQQGVATGIVLAMTGAVKKANYLRGFTDLMKALEDPVRYGNAYIKQMASNFLPWSSFNRNTASLIDPVTTDAMTIAESLDSRNVFDLGTDPAPRRNLLGETVDNALYRNESTLVNINNYLSPLTIHDESRDPLTRYIAEQGFADRRPNPKPHGIDMRGKQFPAPDGHPGTAYHYWEEMIGTMKLLMPDGSGEDKPMNLREAIENFMLPGGNEDFHQQFQDAEGFPAKPGENLSPQAQLVMGMIQTYRQAAFQATLRDCPEFREAHDAAEIRYYESVGAAAERKDDATLAGQMKDVIQQLKSGAFNQTRIDALNKVMEN